MHAQCFLSMLIKSQCFPLNEVQCCLHLFLTSYGCSQPQEFPRHFSETLQTVQCFLSYQSEEACRSLTLCIELFSFFPHPDAYMKSHFLIRFSWIKTWTIIHIYSSYSVFLAGSLRKLQIFLSPRKNIKKLWSAVTGFHERVELLYTFEIIPNINIHPLSKPA